jgi:hypothetical protein
MTPPSSASAAAAAVPAAASAGIVTPANPAHGFRSPAPMMASVPRLFAKLASLGYLGTEASPVAATSPMLPATTNATTTAATVAAAAEAVAPQSSTPGPASSANVFDGGLRSMGSVFTYVTSKWAVLCLFMVDPSFCVVVAGSCVD